MKSSMAEMQGEVLYIHMYTHTYMHIHVWFWGFFQLNWDKTDLRF